MKKGSILLESLLSILVASLIVSLVSNVLMIYSSMDFIDETVEWDLIEGSEIYQS